MIGRALNRIRYHAIKCTFDLTIRGFTKNNDNAAHFNSRIMRLCHDMDRYYHILDVA